MFMGRFRRFEPGKRPTRGMGFAQGGIIADPPRLRGAGSPRSAGCGPGRPAPPTSARSRCSGGAIARPSPSPARARARGRRRCSGSPREGALGALEEMPGARFRPRPPPSSRPGPRASPRRPVASGRDVDEPHDSVGQSWPGGGQDGVDPRLEELTGRGRFSRPARRRRARVRGSRRRANAISAAAGRADPAPRCRSLTSAARRPPPRRHPTAWGRSYAVGASWLRPSVAGSAATAWKPPSSSSRSHAALEASLGMRQSPRGDRLTEPTLGPSGITERLNCCRRTAR